MNDLLIRFLRIANRQNSLDTLLNTFVSELKATTGCEAAGIRLLDEDGHIPYQAYDGFPVTFYESESPLNIHSDHCMCISVLRQETDPNLPFFTDGGSFFINGTTRFLAGVSNEVKGQTRNVCNEYGYESVALIPILMGPALLGLIHLADSHEDQIPLEMVSALEIVAEQLGSAIQRIRAEIELKSSHLLMETKVKAQTAELQRINQNLLREIEEHKKTERALKLNEARLNSLLKLSERRQDSPDRLIESALEESVRLSRSKIGFINFLSEDEKLCIQAVYTAETSRLCGLPLNLAAFRIADSGLWSEAFRQRRPIIVNHYEEAHPGKLGLPEGHIPIRSFLSIPIFEGDRIVAVAALANKDLAYDESDIRQFKLFVDGLWTVLQSRRPEEIIRESEARFRSLSSQLLDIQEKERQRIAAELHDDLGQALMVLKLQLRAVQRGMEQDQTHLRDSIGESLNYIDEITERIRQLSGELSPSILADLGLAAALLRLAEEATRHIPVRVKTDFDETREMLSRSTEVAIYRVFQEGLTNVLKHARATLIILKIKKNEQNLSCLIEDNGQGFEIQAVLSGASGKRGLGLTTMEERLHTLGGEFHIRSQPGKGTHLIFTIPLQKEGPA